MWESTIDGRPLKFHLAGINNQNFIMRDEETGSWWQQVTGEAILGPLKGRKLKLVVHDELSYGTWKSEQPDGRVLRPDEHISAAGQYAPANWDERILRLPVVTQIAESELEPRALIGGVSLNGQSKAYLVSTLHKERLVIDSVGSTPILVITGVDGKSIRGFERLVDQRVLEFFVKSGPGTLRLVDSETGSEWDFAGKAIAGPLNGKQLKKVLVLKDFWFDWKTYHPDTLVYDAINP